MPPFIEGVLILVMIFGFCVGITIVVQLGAQFIESKKKPKIEVKPTPPTIYYVKETEKPKRKTKKARKSPSVAFKGVILSPEQIKIVEDKK